ncbi:MAG: hypothetical protein ACE5J2_08540 [Nitrososphaerales archaeon]
MTRISEATQRKIPRPFNFHWGRGYVIEEVSIRCSIGGNSWEPTIQLLEYDDGTQELRFCVYDGNRFTRMPLIIGSQEIGAIAKQVKRSRRIKNLLSKLAR